MARRDDLQLTAEGLRSLTEVEIPAGRVISVFVDLDPSEFGVVRARASQVSSLVDGLSRTVEALADELAHDELTALRSDRDRIRDELNDLDAEGARGLALFACSPADLWEVLRLPFSVGPDVVVDVVPHVVPLLNGGHAATWAVAIVSRSAGQVLVGGPDGLRELLVRDDDVHGQHDQGGWSQARYERSVDREADEHVRALLDTVRRLHERRGFDHLLVVAGPEVWASVEHGLHAELREILAGRVDADIPGASPEEVLAVVRPEMHRVREQHERELLGRSRSGWAVANARLRDCSRRSTRCCREGWGRSCSWTGSRQPGSSARGAAGWARTPTRRLVRSTASGRNGATTSSRRRSHPRSVRTRRSCASAATTRRRREMTARPRACCSCRGTEASPRCCASDLGAIAARHVANKKAPRLRGFSSAPKRTRTSTDQFGPQGPQPCASTNSATGARDGGQHSDRCATSGVGGPPVCFRPDPSLPSTNTCSYECTPPPATGQREELDRWT